MRAELWHKKAEALAPYSGAGLTARDIARLTGLSHPTVVRYAEKFGFDFTAAQRGRAASPIRKTIENEIVSRLRDAAEAGKMRKEAAKEIGISYHTVIKYGLRHSIPFIHELTDPAAISRAEVMASMYKGGKTLDEIGKLHGITRERVRQLIKKHCGMTAADGGQTTKSQRRREAAKAKKDAASFVKNGCSYDDYMSLVKIGREVMASGANWGRTPVGAFNSQRQNAKSRGISWSIKLWEWWQIWQQSGKWEERGRGKGKYVMCRFGDVGAYEAGNVYIATCEHNTSFQPNNPYRLDHPDHEEAVKSRRQNMRRSVTCRHRSSTEGRELPVGVYVDRNGRYRAQVSIQCKIKYLGTFDTPVAARAAIDALLSEHSLEAAA